MCYVIAKDMNKQGCIAYKTRLGKELAELIQRLNALASHREIQIVTISRPTAYGEYAPYSFVNTREELENAVRTM